MKPLRWFGGLSLVASIWISGCAQMQAYEEAGRYVAPGGRGDQDIAAARARQQAEEQRRVQLNAEQAALNAEVRAVRREMGALAQRQALIDRQLADAVRANRLADQEAQRISGEIQALQKQNELLDRRLAEAKNDAVALQRARNDIAALRRRQAQLTEALRGLALQ
jgi:chromosome segregation ATPase